MQNNRRSQPLALTAYRGRGIGEIKLYRNHAAVFTGPRSSTVTYINDTRLLFPLCHPRHPQSQLVLFCVKTMFCTLIRSS